MKGREEHTLEIEKKLKLTLDFQPGILREYYYSLNDKTAVTKKSYITNILKYFEYINKELGISLWGNKIYFKTVKTSDINMYMEYIRYRRTKNGIKENSECTRATNLYALKSFYDFLVNEEYIDKNPCDRVNIPKDNKEKEIIALTHDELEDLRFDIAFGEAKGRIVKLQEEWRSRDLAIITLGCRTGLRATALSEIDVSDIDFTDKSISVVEKGNVPRKCYFGDDTANVLKDWIKCREKIMKYYVPCDALFVSDRRKRISQATIANIIKRYTQDIDKNITPHKMRSTCATNLYEETGDIYLVADMLGHKNIQNTMRYAKQTEKRRREAANIMDKI